MFSGTIMVIPRIFLFKNKRYDLSVMWFFERKKKLRNVVNNRNINKITRQMELMRIAEYVEMINHPIRMLWINFLIGLVRGFGTAVGFTILGAVVLYILRETVKLNLPLIGRFIAELVKIVQEHLK